MLKLGKILQGISLSLVTVFCLLIFSAVFGLIPQSVLAQETTIDCNLPESIAITFLEAKCSERLLDEPETFYRYYSQEEYKKGRYLTTDQYALNTEVIQKLALKQEWGNQATMIMTVTLPQGTTIYEGLAAPQTPSECYPGGGQQTFITDSKNPAIEWSEGTPITVAAFSCP